MRWLNTERLVRIWAWLAIAGMFGGIFLVGRLHGVRHTLMACLILALEAAGLSLLVFLDFRHHWRRIRKFWH